MEVSLDDSQLEEEEGMSSSRRTSIGGHGSFTEEESALLATPLSDADYARFIYIYIYIYVCVCVCVCVYIYVYKYKFVFLSIFKIYLLPLEVMVLSPKKSLLCWLLLFLMPILQGLYIYIYIYLYLYLYLSLYLFMYLYFNF